MKRILFLIFIMSLATCVNLYAEDVSFEASVDRKIVSLSSVIELTLTIHGTQEVGVFELPDIEGFRKKYIGPSTSVSIVNGQYSSSVAYKYLLFPKEIGRSKIPSLQIELKGSVYTTKTIIVEVVEEDKSKSLDATQTSSVPAEIEDRVFLEIEIDKKDVYLNEKIPVSIKLFASNVALRDISPPELEQIGFFVEEAPQPEQYKELVDGIYYHVVEFKATMYPTRIGELVLGPAQMACTLLYKRQASRGSFGMFQDSFFGDFFDRYEKYPMTILSNSVVVNVADLPPTPGGEASSAVGQFTFSVSVSPREVSVGDPVTIRMTLSGEGNLKGVSMPFFSTNENFKVYDPQIKEEGGVKVLEQVLIPKKEEIVEVPQVRFTYFDVEKGSYQTINQGPFLLEVKASKDKGRLQVIELDAKNEKSISDELGRDLVFIKDGPGRFVPRGSLGIPLRAITGMAVLYTLALAGLFIFFKQKQKIETDAVYAKRIKAPKRAKKELKNAYDFLNGSKSKEFYDAVFVLIKKYLSDKFMIAEGNMTTGEIEGLLKKKRISEKTIMQIKHLIEKCDMMRYGAVEDNTRDMQESYSMLQEVVNALDKI